MTDSHMEFPKLPPYTYVPGHAPHPVSDPDGHLRNAELPKDWPQANHLRWGQHLFNHGFYWEAHEAWEHLWLDLGRTTSDALLVKGLIKLAASGVKCREGNASGAIRHATRAIELLTTNQNSELLNGYNLEAIKTLAVSIAQSPPISFAEASSSPIRLPEFHISCES